MAPGPRKPAQLFFIAALLAIAADSGAVMYKWIDEDGAVAYSNQPPADPSKVKELITIEVVTPEAPAPKPETVTAKPEAPAPKPEIVIVKPEPSAPKPEVTVNVKPESTPPRPEADAASRAIAAPEPETPRHVIPRLTHTEAVQDPCLTSPDRNCPQQYSKHYSPYGGYSPTPRPQVSQTAIAPATGATSAPAAAGSVAGAGSAVTPPNWVVPANLRPAAKPASAKRKAGAAVSTAGAR